MTGSLAEPAHSLPECLRVCELFAGLGGWRVALESMLPEGVHAKVTAYDSGPHCSEVYALNFREQCSRRNIEQLEPAALEGFDLWAMSPPCQPFSTTKEAKQRDIKDRRCKALGHLCGVLPRLKQPPHWIILENVKGFKTSEACEMWRAALAEAGYGGLEFCLDLAVFGAPNHRTRYYLLAERSDRLPSLQRERSSACSVVQGDDEKIEEEDCALPSDGGPESAECTGHAGCAAVHGQPADDFLPPGVLVKGPWAQTWRSKIDAAHAATRAASSKTAQEEAFRHLRACFCGEFASAFPEVAPGIRVEAPDILAGVTGWKLLPLPRSQPDAFLIAFDADRDAGRRLAAELSAQGGTTPDASWSWAGSAVKEPRYIAEYLLPRESLSAAEQAELVVPLSVLEKPFARGLSYVEPCDVQSFCFTGHYGKVLHKSSGSLLHIPGGRPLDRSNPAASHGSVRFFSPKEILNVLGFPEGFQLPSDMELRHRYKVVGNSIAVTVASSLLRLLLQGQDIPSLAR